MGRSIFPMCLVLAISACTIHHVTPYVPDATLSPVTADGVAASTNCFDTSTDVEAAICAAQALAAPNATMIMALHAGLRTGSIFDRDALLASQRVWLLALPDRCRLHDSQGGTTCLQTTFTDRAAALRAWPAPAAAGGAIGQYVNLRLPAGESAQPDPAFCASFAEKGNQALHQVGALDPAAMGYEEVAGTHGAEAAAPVAVDLYDANAFALFQLRGRSVTIGGAAPMITPISLTQAFEARDTANQGGRFSSFASQTGDYGVLDVFRAGARLMALAADPWGSTTPAAPGEAAHAGVWDISGAVAAPVCLFDTYNRPAATGPFEALPNLAALREVLAQIHDSVSLPLGNITKRDQTQLTGDTDFVLLHMPLLAVEQARAEGRTLWLRHRHDDVLDALFAWSTKDPANKAPFDRLFSLLRPAASDLVHAYQGTEGLTASEATQAGGITIMELLYQATTNLAPALGAEVLVPAGYKPRYPILAAPQ